MSSKAEAQKTPVNGDTKVREMIKDIVTKMGPDVSAEEKKEHAKVLIKIFEKDMRPQQAMNISDEEMSLFYSYAYQLFNSGKYPEACELFKMLFVLNPEEGGFASALAACYHKMKDYETAATFYMMHAQMSPFDPVPLFYCYDCLMNTKNFESAYLTLRAVIGRAKDKPEYEKLQDKAEALLHAFDLTTIPELADAITAAKKEEEEEDKE